MTRYLLTLPLILLITLSLSLPSHAQWERHELPTGAAGVVGGFLGMNDVDFDGDLDPLVLCSVFRIVENMIPEEWVLHHDTEISDSAYFFHSAATDLDLDGDQDYIFSGWMLDSPDPTSDAVGWLENLGYPEYRLHFIAHVANSGPLSAGDIDNDGDVDFITMYGPNSNTHFYLHTWWQQPDGSFDLQVYPEFDALSFPSDLVDFNGDGLLEFIASRINGLAVYSWTGSEWVYTMLDVLPEPYGNGYSYFDIDDFDGDGDLDFATIRGWDPDYVGQINWWEHQGGTTFVRHVIYGPIGMTELGASQPIRVLDVDGDGDMDVAVSGIFFINQGNNDDFVQEQYSQDDPYLWDILEKADIDNDGDVDLFNEHVYWYENPTNDPPQFIIRLVPRQTTVPSAGGEVVFDGMVYNQFPQPINGHLWADVTGPNGNSARVWHRRMTVTNGEWLTWPDLGLTVPGGLPAGEYRMTVRAGAAGYGFVPGDSLWFEVEGR